MSHALQIVLQNVCLSALALIGTALAMCAFAAMVRHFFVRLRPLAAAVLLLSAVASTIMGGAKTNGTLQATPPSGQQMQQATPTPFVPPAPFPAASSPRASADMPFRVRSWNRRGAWDDSFRCAFPGGWVFPFGAAHLDRVEVYSQGRILPRLGAADVVADVGIPLQIASQTTSFGCGATDRNSYVFAWTNAVVGRALLGHAVGADTVDASIELFRNGDVAVTTNGVTELVPRTLPFPYDGFGQDDEWVAANFTNAAEILSVGYPQWVDAQVGEGLTNGLYKFTVTIPDVPPETIRLVVGDRSVAVTNVGDYVFLMEKGLDYQYGTVPFMVGVTCAAADDVQQTRGGAGEARTWSVDGRCGVEPQTSGAFGHVWWMPLFFGSPDVQHLGPGDGPLTFTANFSDCRVEPAATYSWTASEGLTVESPGSKTTRISADSMPSWAAASVSVAAVVGGHELQSHLHGFSYGVNATPQIRLSLDVPSAILLNSNAVDSAKVAAAGWSFSCDVPTGGVVTVSCVMGGDRIECQGLLGTWEVSDNFAVTSHVTGVSTSAAVGDVVLQAQFTSGETFMNHTRLLTVVQTENVTLPYAPGDGLVVLTNTPVAMRLDCEPMEAGAFLSTTWHTRRLKSDGTYEDWQFAASEPVGTMVAFTPRQGGIYQVRVLASVAAGGVDERFYVWDADENPVIGLKKRGNLKAFGVCDEQWQVNVRNAAKVHLGSTDYLEGAYLSASHGFSGIQWGRYKCNMFVAHMTQEAGVSLPIMHGRVFSYPPLANELADSGVNISQWPPITLAEFPQPGFVTASHGTENGHCGIVDFDGQGISAGMQNVNRNMWGCGNGMTVRKHER